MRLLAIMASVGWSFVVVLGQASAAQGDRSISLKSEVTRVQPMTGIAFWSDNPDAQRYSDAITLEYRYCGYDEVVTPDGRYDYTKLEAILDEIASRNHQAILRFYFCYVGRETTVPDFLGNRTDYVETIGISEGQKTAFCDWSNPALQEFTLAFYANLAQRYDGDPRIAFLQTGFGLWAEYHIYDGPKKIGQTFPTKKFQARFLRHMDEHFAKLPWSISVDAADFDYTPLEDNAELLALDFGVFDDSFLCKPHPRENAVNWRILGPHRWKRQPGGGEFSYYTRRDQRKALDPRGPNGVAFEDAAREFHITYMIGNDQPKYQPIERIKEAGLATGYRFRVTEAIVEGQDLRLKVTNDGVAPLYRDAYFTAGARRSESTLRGLLPGHIQTCVIEGVNAQDLHQIRIQSNAILPTQTIEFASSLP